MSTQVIITSATAIAGTRKRSGHRSIGKEVILQFSQIIREEAKRTGLKFEENDVYLQIEKIIFENKWVINVIFASSQSILFSIDYTHINNSNINDPEWIEGLRERAILLLEKLNHVYFSTTTQTRQLIEQKAGYKMNFYFACKPDCRSPVRVLADADHCKKDKCHDRLPEKCSIVDKCHIPEPRKHSKCGECAQDPLKYFGNNDHECINQFVHKKRVPKNPCRCKKPKPCIRDCPKRKSKKIYCLKKKEGLRLRCKEEEKIIKERFYLIECFEKIVKEELACKSGVIVVEEESDRDSCSDSDREDECEPCEYVRI